jgi:hypothetical protein
VVLSLFTGLMERLECELPLLYENRSNDQISRIFETLPKAMLLTSAEYNFNKS